MFNALKKLVSSNDQAAIKGQPPPGVQAMGQNLQRKFARGVQYNMKIIIKGDRNVGKSCLFLRLQGQKFKEEYIPTEEIQVTSIQWNYKATDDVVKVEVWDVVDKGKKRKKIEGLKLDNSIAEAAEEPALDAEFIDVYKGTNGVVMMLDVTKQWTFAYIQRELPLVPHHIPVLVLANHRDMGHHRTVTEDQVRYFIEGLDRPPDSAQIRYAEASMRNGFGLKFLHKFFNLPFLQLQRETLLKQLEINIQEINATVEELNFLQESEDQNYDLFLEALTNRRRQVAEQLSQAVKPTDVFPSIAQQNGIVPSSSIPNFGGQQITPTTGSSIGATRSVSVPVNLGQPASLMVPPPSNVQPQVSSPIATSTSTSTTVTATTTVSVVNNNSQETPSKQESFISRLFSKSLANSCNTPIASPEEAKFEIGSLPVSPDNPVQRVEDFVPEGLDYSFNSFLEDASQTKLEIETGMPAVAEESESEGESGNPMVAGFQDELDPEDIRSINNFTVDLSNNLNEREPSSEEEQTDNITANKENLQKSATVPALSEQVSSNELARPIQESLSHPTVPHYGLENEDLSVLEQAYTPKPSNGMTSGRKESHSRSSPSATPEGSEAVSEDSTKSKRRGNKEKVKSEGHRKVHKHKKHKEREPEHKEKKEKKKKKKTKSREKSGDLDSSSDIDRLEEFLGSSGNHTTATELYETI